MGKIYQNEVVENMGELGLVLFFMRIELWCLISKDPRTLASGCPVTWLCVVLTAWGL